MPRIARVVAPDQPHHVTHRGNRRQEIFCRPEDRKIYLRLLAESSREYGLRIWAYALMPNHIHLVVVPRDLQSIAATIRDAHGGYSVIFNGLYAKVGHLWQARYFSCVMDETHLWAAVRYVERNPVTAGLVERAEDYPWSSAAAHCGLRHDPLLSPEFPPPNVIPNWSEWLSSAESEEERNRIRRTTITGRPCGSTEFVSGLEKQLGRTLQRKRPGPPPKSPARVEGGPTEDGSDRLF